MQCKLRYSIGDVSSICNISRKTLRYYDKIGLITTKRQDYNNYRYYTHNALLTVQVIKYYKQMGFTLDEMRNFIDNKTPNVYSSIQKSFLTKIKELEQAQEEIQRQYTSVKDWYDLILEAETVINNNIQDVSIKYIESTDFLYQEQQFENDIQGAIINIDFTNYISEIKNKITGPIIIKFSSFKDRIEQKSQKITILQRGLITFPNEIKMKMGGQMMVACYHIGSHETINETYNKICKWSKKHGYTLGAESFERYVTDYWTTKNDTQFVTEVMFYASRQTTT